MLIFICFTHGCPNRRHNYCLSYISFSIDRPHADHYPVGAASVEPTLRQVIAVLRPCLPAAAQTMAVQVNESIATVLHI